MVVCVGAARYGEAHEFEFGITIFARNRVAVGEYGAYFYTANAAFEVKFESDSLRNVFFLRQLRHKSSSIYKNGMSPDRTLNRDAVFDAFVSEIFHLLDTRIKVVKFCCFVQTLSQGVHIASGHASVSYKTLIHNVIHRCSFKKVFVAHGNKTAHIHNRIFFAAHGHGIRKGEHFEHNFFDGFIGISEFSGFDEIGIFGKSS